MHWPLAESYWCWSIMGLLMVGPTEGWGIASGCHLFFWALHLMGRTVASRAIFNWDREMPCSWIDVVLFSLMGCAGFFHAIFQAKLGEKSIGGYFLLFLIFFWGVSLTFRFTKSSLIYITVHYGWYFGIPSFVHSQSLDSKSSCYLVPSLSYLLHSFTIRIYTVPPFGRHYIYSHACSQ